MDASGTYAAAPKENYANGTGTNIGFGVMLNEDKTLQGRIDYFQTEWERRFYAKSVTYRNNAIMATVRYYMPTYLELLRFFAQAGVERSSTKEENIDMTFIVTTSDRTDIGMVPGIGMEFLIGPYLGLQICGRYHALSDAYSDVTGLAFYF